MCGGGRKAKAFFRLVRRSSSCAARKIDAVCSQADKASPTHPNKQASQQAPSNLTMSALNRSQTTKHTDGENARKHWSKSIDENVLAIGEFNAISADTQFVKRADITIDSSEDRQTVIQAVPIKGQAEKWCTSEESIYTFVRNGKIMKIGGTRVSMKERFGSYLCGHHVPQREKSGKMSVTNAYLYHTIEADLLDNEDSNWELYTFPLPPQEITVDFMGKKRVIRAQIYHGLESHAIEEYRKITGSNPQFSANSDPKYASSLKKMNVGELVAKCVELGLEPNSSNKVKNGPNKGNVKTKLRGELVRLIMEKN